MATSGKSAALSHIGKIRANNQDSGYAGSSLFVVADGMGGHAGGDVASAMAIKRIMLTDTTYNSAQDAEFALQSALLAANALLAETVFDHQELTGMGTTVSAIMLVGTELAIAHIGDSRIYLYRDDTITQVTADHTFVQRLVDSGRITPEEAAVHPRRSVLMRVLGDVDSSPEIDTTVHDVRPGDRWLLCSDGLSGYVSDEKMHLVLSTVPDPDAAAQRLVKESLDQGAPDNVTVVLVDIDDSGDVTRSSMTPPVLVGSAAEPLSFEADVPRRPLRLPTLLLHPLRATPPADEHFEPESEEYLDELILEDRRRARNRRIAWLIAIGVAAIAIIVGILLAYQWTQTRYFVGADGTTVAIYQGVQADVGPLPLSSVYQETGITLASLPSYTRQTVEDTISADSLSDARDIIERLTSVSN
ncbi:MAG: Stp1/IreP family PP2C-type Ser/Thr phosphatase [Burkholderiaceae bacterium]|nr:Stp1/IreP family PP2C-type Ser/Thr phosphatase [Microbacteriaceae bacterium]